MHLSSEPVSLDPSLAEDGISMRMLGVLMDGLPRLAESIAVSPDLKTYRFKLRTGLKWSDGVDLTADDFVLGIQRSLDPKTGSKLAPLFSFLKNVRAEKGTLVIELREPRGFFLQATVLSLFFPQRKDILEKNQNRWPLIAPVTGPYKISEHKNEQYYELVTNEQYWGTRPPIANVIFRIVRDETTALALYEQGKLDIVSRLPAFAQKTFEKSGELHSDPFLATYFLAFNLKNPALKTKESRRAIAAAIHRSDILKTLDSTEREAQGWIPFGLEGYLEKISILPGQLKNPPKKLVLGMDSSSRNSTIGEKIQQDLKKNLKIDLQLKMLDWKSHVKSLSADTPDLYRFGWLAPFNDPYTHLHVFTSKDPNNYAGFKNPAYDELVEKIARLSSGPERRSLIEKAQIFLVADEAVVIPIYHYNQTHAVKPRVQDFRVSPQGIIRANELSLR